VASIAFSRVRVASIVFFKSTGWRQLLTAIGEDIKDGNFTHGYGYLRVLYSHGQGMDILFYLRVVPISYPLSHE
jgi:hypothetical protein